MVALSASMLIGCSWVVPGAGPGVVAGVDAGVAAL